MSEGAEDEEGIVPEVVVHGGQSGVVHVFVDAGWRGVYDGVHREVCGMLPSVPVQVSDVLPDIAGQDTVVTVVIQQLVVCHQSVRKMYFVSRHLEGKDVVTVLVWLVVKLQEVVAHPDEAVVIKPSGVRPGLALGQRDGDEVVRSGRGTDLQSSDE